MTITKLKITEGIFLCSSEKLSGFDSFPKTAQLENHSLHTQMF